MFATRQTKFSYFKINSVPINLSDIFNMFQSQLDHPLENVFSYCCCLLWWERHFQIPSFFVSTHHVCFVKQFLAEEGDLKRDGATQPKFILVNDWVNNLFHLCERMHWLQQFHWNLFNFTLKSFPLNVVYPGFHTPLHKVFKFQLKCHNTIQVCIMKCSCSPLYTAHTENMTNLGS